MTSVAVRRPRRTAAALNPAQLSQRSLERKVFVVWGLTFLNTLGYIGTIVHIPHILGQAVTQGALPAALLAAVVLNRRLLVRPNLFLCLVSLLPLEAILTAMQPQYVGTVYRTFRLVEFVIVLWLLSPWWGRRDLLLVRVHLKCLLIIIGSVLLGIVVAPGKALGDRLSGAVWDIPPTQVAHYTAIATGLIVVLWLCGEVGGRMAAAAVIIGGTMLVLTHTRTALVGMIAGILIAAMSLMLAKARVRRMFAVAGVIAAIAIVTLSSLVTTWLARGQGTSQLIELTGRTKVWGPLLAEPRNVFQEIFGFGLSNSSFNGLPIDSNWLSSYQEQGLFGVSVCILILVFLLVAAYFQPRGVERALALFLVVYCLVASFTEDGFTDATPYLLEITLAASLLVRPLVASRRSGADAET